MRARHQQGGSGGSAPRRLRAPPGLECPQTTARLTPRASRRAPHAARHTPRYLHRTTRPSDDHPNTALFANFTEWFGYLRSQRLRTYFNDHPFPVASRNAGGLQTSPEEVAFRWQGLSEWMGRGLTYWCMTRSPHSPSVPSVVPTAASKSSPQPSRESRPARAGGLTTTGASASLPR